MIIDITDNTKMSTAIMLANRQQYYEALCLFAQVESYESMVNQIACLCQLDDAAYAADMYRIAKQKYGQTRALYADILQFEDLTSSVLNFCEPDKRFARAHDGKLRADPKYLVDLDLPPENDEFPPSDPNYPEESGNFEEEMPLTGFYDIKSTEYYDNLRMQLEMCYLNGDQEQAQYYAKRILALDTDYLPTLEAQISLTLFSEKYKSGVVYAERLANVDGSTEIAVGGAIDIIMRTNPYKHLETLGKLMQKAERHIGEITPYDLGDYVYICTSLIHNHSLAYSFAKALYEDMHYADLQSLKVCAFAFYNYGDEKLAKQAANDLLRALPNDCFAQILVRFLKYTPFTKNQTPIEIAPRVLRHFCVPAKLSVFANRQLCALLKPEVDKTEEIWLGDDELLYISVLILHCKSLMLTNQQKEYFAVTDFLKVLLRTAQPLDKQKFFYFAQNQLFSTMCDQGISECLIVRLLELGFDGKIHIGLTGGYYLLDFSKVKCTEPLFREAFSVCAALAKISPSKLLAAYKQTRPYWPVEEAPANLPHQVAYAMMHLVFPKFSEMMEYDYFADDEKALYAAYCKDFDV